MEIETQWSDFDSLLENATAVLPTAVIDFILAPAGDGWSFRTDPESWNGIALFPRVLAKVRSLDTRISLLGSDLGTPIGVAPTGGHGLVHPAAEAESARGAAGAGALFVLSAYANTTLEDVAAAAPGGPRWFQLPHELSLAELVALSHRAATAGFAAVVLTLDQVVMGDSPLGARHAAELRQDLHLPNIPGCPTFVTAYHPDRQAIAPISQASDDLAALVAGSPLPVVVKGVLRADDAVRCVELGARAVVVSNHGGRHLDGAVPPTRALPLVVRSLNGRVPVLVDGGLRRGEHVLRALALGADAVLVGRAPLLGLALGGADGVAGVVASLTAQLKRAMALCGAKSVAELSADLVADDHH